MSRLIDADLLEEILDVNIQTRRNIGCKYSKLQDEIDDARTEVQKIVYEAQLFSTTEMIRVIREQPTAFDVDKVVEQLEELKEWEDVDGKAYYTMSEKQVINKAIKIVKRGGIDD